MQTKKGEKKPRSTHLINFRVTREQRARSHHFYQKKKKKKKKDGEDKP